MRAEEYHTWNGIISIFNNRKISIMKKQFNRACQEDYAEVLDFINYVFSYSHEPHDFLALLPKLYKPEYFMESIHYTAREEGKIKAVVCSCPLDMNFFDAKSGGLITLPGRGIGMVSVHPYSRSQGYMSTLMKTAVKDMQKKGMVFGCLGGQRQRYEYFGFTPAGTKLTFSFTNANFTHTLGKYREAFIMLEKVGRDDTEIIDKCFEMHETKIARMARSREKFFDIISSWNADIFAIYLKEIFQGYMVCMQSHVIELVISNLFHLPQALGVFSRIRKNLGDSGSVKISVPLFEPEKIEICSGFAENYTQTHAGSFAVFDYLRFADTLVKLRAKNGKIMKGSFTLQIADEDREVNTCIRLFCDNNGCGAEKTNEVPVLSLNCLDATRFLFSPLSASVFPAVRENEFLQSLLPLPLYMEYADTV